MIYTDALEYYSQVQDAANRRIDSAESLYAELHGFFRRGSMVTDEPTKKQLKKDFNALEKGKKDGEIVIKNVSPKTKGGKRTLNKSTAKPCRCIMPHSVAPINAAFCNKARSPLGDRQCA